MYNTRDYLSLMIKKIESSDKDYEFWLPIFYNFIGNTIGKVVNFKGQLNYSELTESERLNRNNYVFTNKANKDSNSLWKDIFDLLSNQVKESKKESQKPKTFSKHEPITSYYI